MVNRKTAQKIRKTHRYLGVFLGLQFLLWTISGLYFSWTNIEDIHGDHFKRKKAQVTAFDNLISPSTLSKKMESISIREINKQPYYLINNKQLFNAKTGLIKNGINKEEALSVAKRYIKDEMQVKDIQLIKKVGKHHEYRKKLLPAYVISYHGNDQLKAYISQKDGRFQTVRHQSWRWFDFLWMTHTMDYNTRDNFNTTLLRAFSILGLVTVLSGFLLWFTTSPNIRKLVKKMKSEKIKVKI
ncbi:MAG: hypothetical protein L3J23_09330 [Flavobacteriaceae bacterium]|nr:hypothetical protein [Flavobacteriaceae bacterium]